MESNKYKARIVKRVEQKLDINYVEILLLLQRLLFDNPRSCYISKYRDWLKLQGDLEKKLCGAI